MKSEFAAEQETALYNNQIIIANHEIRVFFSNIFYSVHFFNHDHHLLLEQYFTVYDHIYTFHLANIVCLMERRPLDLIDY